MFTDKVVEAVHGYLESWRGEYNAMFSPYGVEMGTIFDFECEVVPLEAFPCITMGNPRFRKQWVASTYLLEDVYDITLNGYVAYEDNALNAKLIRMFNDRTSINFEDIRGEEIPLADSNLRIHYHSEMPISEGNIDYTLIGNAFCRSFTLEWRGYLTRQALVQQETTNVNQTIL